VKRPAIAGLFWASGVGLNSDLGRGGLFLLVGGLFLSSGAGAAAALAGAAALGSTGGLTTL